VATTLAVRLPHSADIEANFGVDSHQWKVLVEAVWPEAQSVDSVAMALSYCKARNLDPLKRVVHIVPVWNTAKGKIVDTIWPSIAEARTTATRTKGYAGRDMTAFGPEQTRAWTPAKGEGERIEITFPEWAQVTVYRIIGGVRCAFAGPQTFWMETYASTKGGCPNSMWQKRPHGQLDKCAEAAALRAAFPEELGDEWTDADGPGMYQHTDANTVPLPQPIQPPKRLAEPPQEEPDPTPQPDSAQGENAPEPPKNDQSDADKQAELVNICVEIAKAGKTVVTKDYKSFFLVPAPADVSKDELPFDILATLGSFVGKKGDVVSGKRDPTAITGVGLKITLEKARRALAALPKA
jgi:phage recombination protein Bet